MSNRIATGYGQPPSTFYDWTLDQDPTADRGFILPKDAQNRLLIERFSSKVTQALYRDETDPVGLVSEDKRRSLVKIFERDYRDVEARLTDPDHCKPPSKTLLALVPCDNGQMQFSQLSLVNERQYSQLTLFQFPGSTSALPPYISTSPSSSPPPIPQTILTVSSPSGTPPPTSSKPSSTSHPPLATYSLTPLITSSK